MAFDGSRTDLALNETVKKHVRGVHKLRLVRQHADKLQRLLEQAQAHIKVCQQNEALALQQLQTVGRDKAIYEFSQVGQLFSTDPIPDPSPSTPFWHLEKIADLTVFQHIEARLAKDMEPLRETEKVRREAQRQAFEASKKAKFAEKQIKLEILLDENKLAVLTSQELDREKAKWQRNVLKWLIFANECFADRLNMDVFPIPPEATCNGDCHTNADRKLHVCDCSVEAAFVYIDGLDLAYDLRSERRRWHPEQFVACDIEERKAFCEMAEEIFKVVDGLWQRKRSGLGVK